MSSVGQVYEAGQVIGDQVGPAAEKFAEIIRSLGDDHSTSPTG